MEAFNQIGEWCKKNAPATFAAINAPLVQSSQWAAQRRSGGWPWPVDVVGLYEWCDGSQRSPDGYLFPGFRPLSLTEIVATWQSFLSITFSDSKLPEPQDEESVAMTFYQYANDCIAAHPLGNEPAGTTIGSFFPSWLPIAEDQSGSYLMVDRRKRTRNANSVFVFDEVDADIDAPRWGSFSKLLGSMIRALESGGPVPPLRVRPTVVSGRLEWQR